MIETGSVLRDVGRYTVEVGLYRPTARAGELGVSVRWERHAREFTLELLLGAVAVVVDVVAHRRRPTALPSRPKGVATYGQ